MGGTYQLSNFTNRDSDNPTRRKLIPVAGEADVYDVIRYEGTIRTEGTPWGASTMNAFDSKIANMFPVTAANGGTSLTAETFTPDVYDSLQLNKPLTYGNSGGNRQAIVYRMGGLVYASINVRGVKGYETNDGNSGLCIGRLPYTNTSNIRISASIGEFSLYGGNNENRTRTATGYIPPGSNFIYIYEYDGSTLYNTNLFGTGNVNTSNTLDACITVIYPTN